MLNSLYKGSILLPENNDYYIILFRYKLTEHQKEFVNLGLNCHLYNKYNQFVKENKAEIEILYENIEKLQKQTRLKLIQELKIYLNLELLKTDMTKNKK